MAIEEDDEGVLATVGMLTVDETAERLVVPRFRSVFLVASGALVIERLAAWESAGGRVISTRGAIDEVTNGLAVIDPVVGRVLLTVGVGDGEVANRLLAGVGAKVAAGVDSNGDVFTGGVAGVEPLAGALDTTEPAVDGVDPTALEEVEAWTSTDLGPGSSANAECLSAVIRS